MPNAQIDYIAVVNSIRKQIKDLQKYIIDNDEYDSNPYFSKISPLIKDINFYVNDEQSMIKSKDKLDNNGVYVAVRFGRASINFGSSLCAVSLIILGTANKIKPTQLFFAAFASRYTTTTFDGTNTQQIWVTPSVQTNFNEFADEFRNLLEISGTLIVGNETVAITGGKIIYLFDEDGTPSSEEVPVLTWQDNYVNNLSPQPFGNTEGFSKSETNFSTYTFTISTYLLNSQLVADCMKIRGFEQENPSGIQSVAFPNSNFKFAVAFSNGFANINSKEFFKTFKLVSCGISYQLGEIPTFTASFTH